MGANPELITAFVCGQRKDHECDSDGPVICGGENPDGTYWSGPESDPENRKRATWGSVTCSKCGDTAMSMGEWSYP